MDLEYAAFVKKLLREFVSEFDRIAEQDEFVYSLRSNMAELLNNLENGVVPLPTDAFNGWLIFFSPEGPHNINERFPKLMQSAHELFYAVRRPDMATYERDMEAAKQMMRAMGARLD